MVKKNKIKLLEIKEEELENAAFIFLERKLEVLRGKTQVHKDQRSARPVTDYGGAFKLLFTGFNICSCFNIIQEQKQGHTFDAFNLVHKRKDKHKSWIDDAFEQMGAKISQELIQLVATHGDETPELRLQAYVTWW
ncbi:Uncharacterized protein Fot_11406 [Forsythia ovata]|uniref:Uncharacterized protein n=1 Tax=Forsythia ovata TaxID=205694 RepID=A0ABD1WJZ7_9LAMI